jgi:REP element-mobilizing transposase RayT
MNNQTSNTSETTALPARKSIRLPHYDYAQAGMYFVTVCTEGRVPLFGEIEGGVVVLSEVGRIVDACWQAIPEHFADVTIDEYVVMPDHFHGLVSVGARHAVPATADGEDNAVVFGKPIEGSLSTVMRSFKSVVTKQCNAVAGTACRAPTNVRMSNHSESKIWQRGFWERVIRDERELRMVREYIRTNPLRINDDHDLTAMFETGAIHG